MTREEQIGAAYRNHLRTVGNPTNGFEYGARWADENPESPWISVKERMPEDGQFILFTYYLAKEDLIVFRTRHYSRQYPDAETLSMQHWMPIPKLPMEG